MEILLITNGLPYPPTHGGKVRAWNLLRNIARHHNITLLSLLDTPDDALHVPVLRQYCRRVETVLKKRRRPKPQLLRRLLKTILKGQPPRNGITYYSAMEAKIRQVTTEQTFDIIQIEQSSMAPYIEFVQNARKSARIISLYDVGVTQIKRIGQVQANNFQSRFWAALDSFFLLRWEPSYLAQQFDRCVVVSSIDAAFLRQSNPNLQLTVVPNGVDTTQYNVLSEPTDSKEIVFVGNMRYAPNVDGALFFCKEIFPLIKQQVPNVKLLLVGSTPTAAVQSLTADDVVVTGFVESVVPYYQNSIVSVVPLRAGSGTRLKILESMALGRPVISTTLGAEGLAVTHGKNILIADTPADFARQTAQTLNNLTLRQQLIAKGRQLVEQEYDWQRIAQKLLKLYEDVGKLK